MDSTAFFSACVPAVFSIFGIRYNPVSTKDVSMFKVHLERKIRLRAFSTNTTCKLHVLGHDGNALSMDSAEVGVLEKSYEVGFSCLL